MEKDKNFQKKKIGKSGYINENCYLAKTLNYPPYERCQYCELKFRDCLFLHYQVTSLILVIYLFILSFLIEGRVPEFLIISVFVLVIIYGYFLNRSTNKIIQANFAQRKANEALEELNKKLEEQVEQRTEKLKKAYEKLEKLDMIKTEFISIASHQLRTPLSGVKGYLSMLLEGDFGDLDEKKREVIKDLFQNTERLVRLVNLFLNVSRIEMGKFSLEKSSVDMDALIEETIKEFVPEIEKKKLKVEFKKSGESKPIFADRDKIKDVVLNLLDNAIKYTDRGSIILETNFKLNRSGKKSICQFSIKDTGMGIKKEDMNKLFGKFTRGTSLPDFTKTGSGLGLFIAKKNVEAHKGKIWVESAGEGKGSEFYFEVGEK